MQNGTANAIIFIVAAFIMGSIGTFFPRWLLRRIEKSSQSKPIYGFVGEYYSGPNAILKLRVVGFFIYAMGAFLLFWTFIR